ncbi:hypothetical protein C8R47DRAFT_1156631 [Mycena vitilis]|nr:hypothetical protein C8R47DRAFT_1156631 [Mycena vitilis]
MVLNDKGTTADLKRTNSMIELLETRLARAANMSLSIAITVAGEISSQKLRPVEKLISHYRDRLENVAGPTTLFSAPITLPKLHYLELESVLHGKPTLPYLSAPNLRKAHLRHYHGRPTIPYFPYPQLTEMTMDGMTARECIEILTCTDNLVRCELIVLSPVEGSAIAAPLPQIALPHLESLVFITRDTKHGAPLKEFIDKLTLPRLRALQIPEGATCKSCT